MSEIQRKRRKALYSMKQPEPKKRGGCLKWVFLFLLLIILVVAGYLALLYRNTEKLHSRIYTPRSAEQQTIREVPIEIGKDQKPFSVLVLGIDTGELGRTEKGRSDVMMLMTLNATTNQTTVVSIPRDTRTEIVGQGIEDKINHAYAFGGVPMSVNTVQKLIDLPIDYTVTVNMGDFEKVIDAIGGIEITPITTFSESGYQFVEGQKVKMDGKMALAYARNRYDSGGDYGRQERQRQMLAAVLKAGANIGNLVTYQTLFDSLSEVVKTDMTFEEAKNVVQHYTGALQKVTQVQLKGTGAMIDNIYYDITDPDSLIEVQRVLREQLALTE